MVMMKTKIVAHRGASHNFPENTIAAFEAACLLEVDGIECDLQLTKDEKVVVFHDSFLEKAGLPDKKICEMNFKEVQQLDVGSWFAPEFKSQTIPSLEDLLLSYAHRTTLFLEIKANEYDPRHDLLVDCVMRCLEQHELIEDVLLLSFNAQVLQRAFKHNPQIKTVLNINKLNVASPELKINVKNCYAVSLNIEHSHQDDAIWVKTSGKKLMAWTCNSDEQVCSANKKKADYVMSDKPAWLQKKLLT